MYSPCDSLYLRHKCQYELISISNSISNHAVNYRCSSPLPTSFRGLLDHLEAKHQQALLRVRHHHHATLLDYLFSLRDFYYTRKVRIGLITQMWSNLLSTSDFSIKYYDEPKLCLEENSKMLDDLYKGLIYLPLSLGGGRKVIYMGDVKGGEVMALEVSDSSLQTLMSLNWVSNPFWSVHRPKSINPLCKETDKQNLKLYLGVTCGWIRLFAKNILLQKYHSTLHKGATYANQCMDLDPNVTSTC